MQLDRASRRRPPTDRNRSRVFKYQLELEDGTAADPPAFTTAVPNSKAGDTIPLGAGRSLRVVEVRQEVLVVAPG
jgi:hypothetical protein